MREKFPKATTSAISEMRHLIAHHQPAGYSADAALFVLFLKSPSGGVGGGGQWGQTCQQHPQRRLLSEATVDAVESIRQVCVLLPFLCDLGDSQLRLMALCGFGTRSTACHALDEPGLLLIDLPPPRAAEVEGLVARDADHELEGEVSAEGVPN